ncbi:MAG: FAD-dependent oxidoreductase [Methylococcaceae bacterium]|nr:FAD-dependent oxidoreductase [Methylococcaceae bacterium]
MPIVVIGSGIAGVSFAEEIRKLDPQASVALLTRETLGYYSRPLLSHGFSREDIETRIVMKSFAVLAQTGLRVESGAEVLRLDRGEKTVLFRRDGREQTIGYDKLVLATGSAAFIPPPFLAQAGMFHLLNSLDDLIILRRLRESVSRRFGQPRWAVIGGGLIGCEVAADLARAGDRVVLFHALARLMEKQLVAEDSASLLEILREVIGVEVRLDQAVQGFAGEEYERSVQLADGSQSGFHGIIVACGFKPRKELAQAAGLETRRGVAVNQFLLTSDPNIHAIGDSAELPDGRLYAYVTPVRSQALWLAKHLVAQTQDTWPVPLFKPKAKIPGFEAAHPYLV